jgi:DNA-directed RNA polymerase omega subunit
MDAEEPLMEAVEPQPAPVAVPQIPAEPVDPPDSRFLFVDIAALRAKQLRRGALPRLDLATMPLTRGESTHKPERIAMEEVRRGLVPFIAPEPHEATPEEQV